MYKKLLLSAVAVAAATSAVAAEGKAAHKAKAKHSEKAVAAEETKSHGSDVKVTLGGKMDVQAGFVSQTSSFKYVTPTTTPAANAPQMRKNGLVNNTDLTVAVDASAKGFKYGGKVVLNADNSANTKGSPNPAKETLVYAESMFGRLEAGATDGATTKMSAKFEAAATGGAADGDWTSWYNNNWTGGGNANAMFLTSADLPADYTDVNAGVSQVQYNANKVSYYTPSWNGMRFGVSYTPDTTVSGTTSSWSLATKNRMVAGTTSVLPTEQNTGAYQGFEDVFSGGFSFAHSMNGVDVKVSALGQSGKSKDAFFYGVDGPDAGSENDLSTDATKRYDLRAYELALQFGYKGFKLGGSYADLGKSGEMKVANGASKTNYWTLGTGYEHGAFNGTVSYFRSERGGEKTETRRSNELDAVAVGVEYKLAQGFMPYAEYTRFKLVDKRTSNTNKTTNKGSVVLVGTKLFF